VIVRQQIVSAEFLEPMGEACHEAGDEESSGGPHQWTRIHFHPFCLTQDVRKVLIDKNHHSIA